VQVKTYVGRSATEVMGRIKAELGTDAIILGTKTVTKDDGSWVEIMAARETPLPPSPPQGPAAEPADPLAPTAASLPGDADSLRREWELLRRHLMAALKPGLDTAMLSPRHRALLDTLEREGVEDSIRLSLIERLRTAPTESILPILERLTPMRPWWSSPWPGRVHLFAGPSGCGTSSVVLRLALHLKRTQPQTRVLLAHAVGNQGRLVLRHYAELSGIAFCDVLREGWPAPEAFDLLLVDASPATLDALPAPLAQDALQHAVLAPLFSEAQTRAFMQRFLGPRTASIVWTKLDEACSFGQIVNQAVRTQLPVSLVSVGAEIKNTLAAPSTRDLWRLVLRHDLPHPNPA
jgi:flagellar biosynthesis protein FlhF